MMSRSSIPRRIESEDKKLISAGTSYAVSIPPKFISWLRREWKISEKDDLKLYLLFIRDHNEVANNKHSFMIILPYCGVLNLNDYGPVILNLLVEGKRANENNQKGLKHYIKKLWDYYLITWGEEE